MTDYFAECSYAECNQVRPDDGRSLEFRGQMVVISANCSIVVLGSEKENSHVKLSVLKANESIPQAAREDTVAFLKQWDETGRFEEVM